MKTNFLISISDDLATVTCNATSQEVHGWSYQSLDRYAECVVLAEDKVSAVKKAIVKAQDSRIVRVIPFDVARGANKLLKRLARG